MAKYRQNRINEEMQKELMGILRRVKDPRVQDAFVSVTAVDCTADLKYAKIYFSVIGDEQAVKKGLESAAGYIRTQLARTLNLRITPELKFVIDDSVKRGAHINEVLKQISAEKEAKAEKAKAEENEQ